MNSIEKRTLGYGTGLLVVGALLYLGFVHVRQVKADIDTLLGSAEMHVRLASSMPANGKDGKPLEARTDLIQQAREFLDDADAQRADYPPARELRAHLLYLEGRYADAAAIYAWLRQCESSTPEQRDLFVLNESRMRRAAGDASGAERALNAHKQEFLTRNEANSQIERAHVLVGLDRKAEAVEAIKQLAAETEVPMVLLSAGFFLERQGQADVADNVYRKAALAEPIAHYYRARLKVKRGQYDSGMDLLERAMCAAGSRVRGLLRQDHKIWSPCTRTKRFRDLLEPTSKSARPGR
ncbi:MAG: hypothetical protein ACYTGW_18970 [Planctomycetota bacterium]